MKKTYRDKYYEALAEKQGVKAGNQQHSMESDAKPQRRRKITPDARKGTCEKSSGEKGIITPALSAKEKTGKLDSCLPDRSRARRRNDNDAWIQTYTGKRFYPLDPREEDICIEDIAHALSNECRFNGHCNRFYSVAEHTNLGLELMEAAGRGEPFKRLWLLHDASEAYLKDLPRPVKNEIRDYRTIEAKLHEMIYHRFGIDKSWLTAMYEINGFAIDDIMLATERRELFDSPEPWPNCNTEPTDMIRIPSVPPPCESVESEFLDNFYKLFKNNEATREE